MFLDMHYELKPKVSSSPSEPIVGLFAVTAFAGHTNQTSMEAISGSLGFVSFCVTVGIAIIRERKAEAIDYQ